MREINFHNGAVIFRAPDAWQESRDDEHTIVLFQTAPTPMTLRLTVVNSNVPAHAKEASAQALMRLTGGPTPAPEAYGEAGRAFKRFTTSGGSPEHATFIRFWHFGIRGSGLKWMQAVFSLTVDEKDRELPAVEAITTQLDAEIRQSTFDPDK